MSKDTLSVTGKIRVLKTVVTFKHFSTGGFDDGAKLFSAFQQFRQDY